jgi:ligand-binding sensor domain-containing protein
MKNIPKLSHLLAMFVLTFFSGCAKPAVEPSIANVDIPNQKLTKTQGSTQYDTMRCGLQDKAGNLWFGTTGEGVYRYDKKGFTQFTARDGLSSNTVWSIMEDKKGRIWFGTDSGLSRWDGTSIRHVPISTASELSKMSLPIPNAPPSEKPAVWSMMEDKKGTIWVGTSVGMFCCKDEAFTTFLENAKVRNADGLQLKMVESILEDRQGNVWFASGMPPGMEGLCRFDGISLTRFNPGGEKWIRTVIEDRDGILWLGTRNKGAWRYDGKTFSSYTEQPGLGTPRLVDRSGNIWFGGEGRANGLENETGIWRYDGKTFRNFSTREGMGNLDVWNEVWCIVADRDGNIWVGTRNTGLYRYDGKSFVSFSD